MKKFLLITIAFLLATTAFSQKQKFGYVDTEYILGKMPEYRSAQKQLDEISNGWQAEVDKKYSELDAKFKEYKAEEPLLTKEQKKEREQEIVRMETEVKKYENEKFGQDGELFKKRQELIKPIQDKVFKAIQNVAKEGAYDFVFDIAGNMVVLITDPKYDLSDNVLEELGITSND
ncbi:MAG: OmpH family outer membrane protein [Bacteroidetes bacterium]|nr:OmpH family outer membrane protein [Bacteroidota bacterium]